VVVLVEVQQVVSRDEPAVSHVPLCEKETGGVGMQVRLESGGFGPAPTALDLDQGHISLSFPMPNE
jgi:hypothetical protein